MARVLILSGAGRYGDAWHNFDETSAAVAQILTDRGHQAVVRRSCPEALDTLPDADLLVVNTGGGDPEEGWDYIPAWSRAHAKILDHWESGKPILGLHTAANTFCDWELWPTILGGKWVPGVSGHPERSYAVFEPMPGAEGHPALRGVDQVVCYDERYSNLVIDPLATPLLFHETSEEFQVVDWVMGNNVIYDGLGHSGRSYESASRRMLLCSEVSWLLNWKKRLAVQEARKAEEDRKAGEERLVSSPATA
ncbi:ThuA domain-containing protein [Acidipropionibacterium jensenii]|uniref:Glycosyl hydrolase n=1 Tax=Acidipropionibacterium jensenii TaxID=1749 RepID=A0A3Q9UKP6_9ACTN|nr:ThuA domain-containing protein [Acidipropionibacterium jensenii]AZZ40151.1 glycosyl hydrolase [Acidipropionibacterium jensenii]MDN5977081.1 ThuA domain-containing protein [Acidipropionibacterium jensenii]MDN5996827.1 ThuA domain-containing protein [Acidipropionibacterium jensenii]MDN6427981.1 ThuA domain-containing protein [Acidipropionibacterium jensenii]MDN6442035.1 ThuA domain-containing protein [Acidipropionibacterium jensenii]